MAKFLPWMSVAMYAVACLLPAMTLSKISGMGTEVWYGWHVLAFGWMGLPLGSIVWGANIFWIAGSVFLLPSKGKIPAVFLLAAALALALLLPDFTIALRGERGELARFSKELHAGAYLWLASIATQLGVAIYTTAADWRTRYIDRGVKLNATA